MIEELWALEHSQYSENKILYPWHIGLLKDAIEKNLIDCQHNNRGSNKWQIVFIGPSFEACQQVCNELEKVKKVKIRKAYHGIT